jgi:hypothetical protein
MAISDLECILSLYCRLSSLRAPFEAAMEREVRSVWSAAKKSSPESAASYAFLLYLLDRQVLSAWIQRISSNDGGQSWNSWKLAIQKNPESAWKVSLSASLLNSGFAEFGLDRSTN